MRLSGFVLAAVLSVSAFLFAQHSGGAGSGGAAASHSSYSGGSASSASSHSYSGPTSHVGSTSPASHSLSSSKSPSAKAPEQKSARTLFHPFRKLKPSQSAELIPARCVKEPCAVCPPGQSRGAKGGCVAAANACYYGQSWNGYACSGPVWFNDCRALAEELEEQQRLMRGQDDATRRLRYQMLLNQYAECERRFGREPFGAYAFNDALLLDMP